MWTEGLLIAIVGALAAVLVELVKARKRQDKVVHEVTPNSGTSMKDQLGRVEKTLDEMREQVSAMQLVQARTGERMAALEAVSSYDHDRKRR